MGPCWVKSFSPLVTAPTLARGASSEPAPPLMTLTPFRVAVLREIVVLLATVIWPVGTAMTRPKMLL